MQEDQKNRFILLAVVGLLISALLIILAFSRLTGSPDQNNELTLSGDRVRQNQQQIVPIEGEGGIEVATNTVKSGQLNDLVNSWQDDTVDPTAGSETNVTAEPAGIEDDPVSEPTPPTAVDPFPAADLSGLGFDSQLQTSVGSGGPLPTGLPASSGTGGTVGVEFETLPDSTARDCGSLTIPTSAFGLAFFSTGLSSNPEVICMGEAVADDCETHALNVTSSDGLAGEAYVAEDTTGRCGVGFKVDGDDMLMLCDLETILERTHDEDLSWSVWESRFEADPGSWMGGLISSNFGLLTNPAAATDFGCVTYALE